ncbi:hypothetical protein BTVI_111362 [Pitangus sulphuratus]|nr:hypothetical protein BTVI_111362 [Pitangus sulphuratus]
MMRELPSFPSVIGSVRALRPNHAVEAKSERCQKNEASGDTHSSVVSDIRGFVGGVTFIFPLTNRRTLLIIFGSYLPLAVKTHYLGKLMVRLKL